MDIAIPIEKDSVITHAQAITMGVIDQCLDVGWLGHALKR